MSEEPPTPRSDEAAPSQGRLVQDLLTQVRYLKIENERLRLEARDAKETVARPDPRVATLEIEISRLRDELADVRAALASAQAEQTELEGAVGRAVDALMRAASASSGTRRPVRSRSAG